MNKLALFSLLGFIVIQILLMSYWVSQDEAKILYLEEQVNNLRNYASSTPALRAENTKLQQDFAAILEANKQLEQYCLKYCPPGTIEYRKTK